MIFWAAITSWGETLEDGGGARKVEMETDFMRRMGEAAWPALVAEEVARQAWDEWPTRADPPYWPIVVEVASVDERRLGAVTVQLDFEPKFVAGEACLRCAGCAQSLRGQPKYAIVGEAGEFCRSCHDRICGKER